MDENNLDETVDEIRELMDAYCIGGFDLEEEDESC